MIKTKLYFYDYHKVVFDWLRKMGIIGRDSHLFALVVEDAVIDVKAARSKKILYNGWLFEDDFGIETVFGARNRHEN